MEVRNLVSALIDPKEAKVSVLSHSPIFDFVNHERSVTSFSELCRMSIVDRKTDSLSAKPIANIVRISIVKCNPDTLTKHIF